jgi:peroxiredoxin Q/BCP
MWYNVRMLEIGTKAPDFELQDQNGDIHKLSDYQGQIVLVYFYPKDNTPGCTREACAIRDVWGEFKKAGIKVFGISKDSVDSHKKFEKKFELPFTLLSDPKMSVIKPWGAARLRIGTKRISYLIDKKGNIAKAYSNVKPEEHADEILEDVSLVK